MNISNDFPGSKERSRGFTLTGFFIHSYMGFSLVWVWLETVFSKKANDLLDNRK